MGVNKCGTRIRAKPVSSRAICFWKSFLSDTKHPSQYPVPRNPLCTSRNADTPVWRWATNQLQLFVKQSSLCMKCFVVPAGVLRDSHAGRDWRFQYLNSFGWIASPPIHLQAGVANRRIRKSCMRLLSWDWQSNFAYYRKSDKTPSFWMFCCINPLTFIRFAPSRGTKHARENR